MILQNINRTKRTIYFFYILQEDEIAIENVSKQRVGNADEARKTCLLELFTDHFVAMAKESNRKRSYGQGLMYVMQAENLLQLLGEDYSK